MRKDTQNQTNLKQTARKWFPNDVGNVLEKRDKRLFHKTTTTFISLERFHELHFCCEISFPIIPAINKDLVKHNPSFEISPGGFPDVQQHLGAVQKGWSIVKPVDGQGWCPYQI
eukprot:TRINITY_DN568_c0_g2_i1.p2 TRINITY_DN568_c0_g2~~TRINITY_DN568_c0_g2_i1.p2  ORF type:complete len:114 (-),score=18.81 TRINITY_DN568_c0_g2_i1:120-461(-)